MGATAPRRGWRPRAVPWEGEAAVIAGLCIREQQCTALHNELRRPLHGCGTGTRFGGHWSNHCGPVPGGSAINPENCYASLGLHRAVISVVWSDSPQIKAEETGPCAE